MAKEKKMGLISLIGMLIAGIIVVDTFAIPAAMGFSALGLWLIVVIFFMIPNGFINAELGSRDGNGLVSWIKNTLGEKHATIMGFFYWVNVSLWMPAVFIVLSFWFGITFFPDGDGWTTLHWAWMLAIGITVNWIIVFIVRRGIGWQEIINNISAITKIFILLLLGILGIIYIAKNGISDTGLSVGNFFPSLSSMSSIGLITAIVFNLLGFELISSIGDKIKNSKKNIPLAIIIGALIIGGLYIFGTLGILAGSSATNIADDSYLETALPYSLENLIVNKLGGPRWLFQIVMCGVLFALATSMIAWISGASEILEDLDFTKKYKIFSDRHSKYQTFSKSFILMGVISTIFIFMGSMMEAFGSGGSFWTILALSMIVFIIPYLYLSPALIMYRNKKFGENEGAVYKIPGGKIVMWLCSILNFLFVALAIIMIFFEPVGDSLLYYLIISIGTVVCTSVGVYLYWDTHKKKI